MKVASSRRFGWAVLLAALLALRLLSPAGFMPTFDHGAVTIVICPDADPLATSAPMHHHRGNTHVHQPCPFAAASGLDATGMDWAAAAAPLLFGAALLLGRTYMFVERHRRAERPPAIGPPDLLERLRTLSFTTALVGRRNSHDASNLEYLARVRCRARASNCIRQPGLCLCELRLHADR